MKTKHEHMICKCGKTAVMHVGDQGYCSGCKAAALKANALDAAHIRARAAIKWRKP